jgi:hypothetical protein
MNIVPLELDTLVYWISERDRIRAAKGAGAPRPWTVDPLLRDFRWCNVRRMDDAVSLDMVRSWYDHDADPATALTAACLGRLVNWPESLMAVTGGEPFRIEHLGPARSRLEQRVRSDAKVFTGAYVVPGSPGESKIETVVKHAEHVCRRAGEIFKPTMRATWAALVEIDGLGRFLAGQMVADVAHLSAGSSWADRHEWAPIGPGSARGLNRLLGRPKDQAVTQLEFDDALPRLIAVLRPRIETVWADRQLQAMDIQNCLCEFDKYRRLQLAEGKVRSRYDGAGKPQGVLL